MMPTEPLHHGCAAIHAAHRARRPAPASDTRRAARLRNCPSRACRPARRHSRGPRNRDASAHRVPSSRRVAIGQIFEDRRDGISAARPPAPRSSPTASRRRAAGSAYAGSRGFFGETWCGSLSWIALAGNAAGYRRDARATTRSPALRTIGCRRQFSQVLRRTIRRPMSCPFCKDFLHRRRMRLTGWTARSDRVEIARLEAIVTSAKSNGAAAFPKTTSVRNPHQSSCQRRGQNRRW